ncbi:MAG: hypothetical protein NZ824_02985 [Candidatus Thioglobus sp.]|nr:hypothetical protein [Candidatus Thioglobus sp.]
MKEIYELEYKGNFRSKGEMTKGELLKDLVGHKLDFEEWCGHMLIEFEEAIAEVEEEVIKNAKDYY